MNNDLLERPDQKEDDGLSWYKGNRSDDPKSDEGNGSAGGRDKKKEPNNNSPLDNDAITSREGKGADGASKKAGGALPGESEAFKVGKELGNKMAGAPMSRMGAAKFVMQTRRGKAVGITGVLTTVALAFFGFSAGSLQLIHLKNNLLGNSDMGRFQQNTLTYRTTRSLTKLVTKSGGYATKKTINAVKLESKLDKAGFKVVRNEADDAAIRIIKKVGGEDIADIAARGGDDAIKLSQDLDKAVSSSQRLFSGKATRNGIVARLGGKISWLKNGGKAGEKASDVVNKQLDDVQDVAERNIQRAANGTLDEALTAGTTEADRATTGAADSVGGTVDEAVKGVDDAAIDAAQKTADDVGTAVAAKGGTTISTFVDDIVPLLVKESPSIFGKLAGGAARAISITEPIRIGCTVRGTINFFSSIRNVQVFKIVATGFLRFLTATDEQAAGVITSSGLNVLAVSMNEGGGIMQSGALQERLGVAGAAPSSKESGLLSNARAPTGIFGLISNIINAIPGINNPTVCRFAHNGLVIVGSAVVGAVVGFFSGGSSVAATGYLSIALTFAEVAITTIGVPLFANYLEGRVSAAFRGKGTWGGSLTAGSDAFQGTIGPVNGLGITSNTALAKIKKDELVARKYNNSQKSLYDKYFNIAKADSLLGTLAFRSPKSPSAASKTLANLATSTTAMLGTGGVGMLSSPLGAQKAYAADIKKECYKDPQLEKHDVAVTSLCYPIIASFPNVDMDEAERALLTNGDIDGGGDVLSQGYKDYIKNCLSGRGGMLFTEEVDKDGKNNPADDTCVSAGDLINGFTYGTNVYRQVYYGMIVDMDNLTESINDEYVTDGDAVANDAASLDTNNNLFVLGDSLTSGMQSLGGTVASKDHLAKQLNSKGWSTVVNAQGCRGVYQPSGPIAGDGSSCPRESIVDGLTVVNTIAEPLVTSLKNSGTYVIGLGTNATERTSSDTDEAKFKQRAIELIDRIRSPEVSPNATIYWVNLSLANKTRESQRNQVINQLVTEKNIKLIDWASQVNAVNGNSVTTDDIGFADSVHHTSSGYSKKVDFVVNAVGQAPAGSFSNSTGLDCTGYKETTGPTTTVKRAYSATIQAQCAKLKQECATGVNDTRRIICSAFEFDGVYYGNGYSASFAGAKAIPIYGFNANGGNYGLQPKAWLDGRTTGLSAKNLLECSGLTAVALYKAYNFSSGSLYCSGQFTNRANPALFEALTPEQIKPGDFLTLTFGCNNGGSGHVAIAASTPDANGNLIVYETNSWKRPVRFTEKNLAKDFPAGRSRFIPQGVK